MSLEIFDDEVKRKHIQSSGFGSGRSLHEHAASQLLYPHTITTEELPDGSTKTSKEIDVDGRTELPSPSNTSVLQYYAFHLDSMFGKGKGNGMRYIDEKYRINMISKNRKGRTEFTMVATASALNADNQNSDNILKKVQTS